MIGSRFASLAPAELIHKPQTNVLNMYFYESIFILSTNLWLFPAATS